MHVDYAREYARAQVTSVDRTRLLLLVFEGGLAFLQRARAGLAGGDLAAFGHNLPGDHRRAARYARLRSGWHDRARPRPPLRLHARPPDRGERAAERAPP